MASGHVNRANRPNTWPQPTNCTVKKTLASREPSTHGTSRACRVVRRAVAIGGKAGLGASRAYQPNSAQFISTRPNLTHRRDHMRLDLAFDRPRAEALRKGQPPR